MTATGTTKSLLMKNNSGTGTLAWNPTANRTLTLPNTTDTIAVAADLTNKVAGSANGTPTALTLWTGTQAQYDAVGTKNSATVYVVTA